MANGEPITKIARDLGYADHSGIIHRLADDPEYSKALRSGVYGKLEKREAELEVADTNVTVTRADRLLGHARWFAERIDRATFGDKLQVEHQGQAPILQITVVTQQQIAPQHEVIEHDLTVVNSQAIDK